MTHPAGTSQEGRSKFSGAADIRTERSSDSVAQNANFSR